MLRVHPTVALHTFTKTHWKPLHNLQTTPRIRHRRPPKAIYIWAIYSIQGFALNTKKLVWCPRWESLGWYLHGQFSTPLQQVGKLDTRQWACMVVNMLMRSVCHPWIANKFGVFCLHIITAMQSHWHLCKISCWIHQILYLKAVISPSSPVGSRDDITPFSYNIYYIYTYGRWAVCHRPHVTLGPGTPPSLKARYTLFNLVWCGNKRQRGGWTSHCICLSTASSLHSCHKGKVFQSAVWKERMTAKLPACMFRCLQMLHKLCPTKFMLCKLTNAMKLCPMHLFVALAIVLFCSTFGDSPFSFFPRQVLSHPSCKWFPLTPLRSTKTKRSQITLLWIFFRTRTDIIDKANALESIDVSVAAHLSVTSFMLMSSSFTITRPATNTRVFKRNSLRSGHLCLCELYLKVWFCRLQSRKQQKRHCFW